MCERKLENVYDLYDDAKMWWRNYSSVYGTLIYLHPKNHINIHIYNISMTLTYLAKVWKPAWTQHRPPPPSLSRATWSTSRWPWRGVRSIGSEGIWRPRRIYSRRLIAGWLLDLLLSHLELFSTIWETGNIDLHYNLIESMLPYLK